MADHERHLGGMRRAHQMTQEHEQMKRQMMPRAMRENRQEMGMTEGMRRRMLGERR